jgi:UDP-N-acetylmuramoylalanine--D-glutamate ligase
MTLIDQCTRDFSHQRILIFGLGLLGSNLGLARFFASMGCPLRITDLKTAAILKPSLDALSDIKAEYSLGKHRPQDIDWADIIIRSASVPWEHPLLNRARDQHKPIHMDAELFLTYTPGVTVIGITGTRGKTTTTSLIFELLKQTGRQLILGGNVKDVCTLPLIRTIKDPQNTIAVLELSSWQLQAFHNAKISPSLAVLTNLYPDHLNVYANIDSYYADKQAIYCYQKPSDMVLFNDRVSRFHDWAKVAPGKVQWYSDADLPPD